MDGAEVIIAVFLIPFLAVELDNKINIATIASPL